MKTECHTKQNKSDQEGEISYDIPYTCNLKRNDTNECTFKTEILTDLENELVVARGRDDQGVWEGHVHTASLKMDSEQRPIVQHMELYSMLCARLDERGGWEENGYMSMYG